MATSFISQIATQIDHVQRIRREPSLTADEKLAVNAVLTALYGAVMTVVFSPAKR